VILKESASISLHPRPLSPDMPLAGKGFFTWQLARCEGGSPVRIAARAADAGLSHVLIKIADGIEPCGDNGLNRAVVQALREQHILVWGWHYVYGRRPDDEARVAIGQVRGLGLDGYCIDAEAEYTQPGKEAAARRFATEVRGALPDVPLALSSYRYPSLHAVPWAAFLERCDVNMPQMYWEQAHNPDQQLRRSARELLALRPQRPVFPTGAAYGAGGWEATAGDLRVFLNTAREMGLAGANFYSWDYAGSPRKSGLWDAVAKFDWPPQAPDLPAPEPAPRDDSLVTAYFSALNAFDLERLIDLYHPNAVHVTSQRLALGADALLAWFQDLIDRRLRLGAFTLTEVTGAGVYRRFKWAADSYSGTVEDGDDTIGIRDGRIQYHYTYFSVTG
jgi:hypothetical protein